MSHSSLVPAVLLGMALAACGREPEAPSAASAERWFDVPAEARTTLMSLTSANGERWHLVSGWQCLNCDAPVTLFLTTDTTATRMRGPYGSPGAYFQMGNDEGPADAHVRAFAGDCLGRAGDELVILDQQYESGAATSRSAYVVRVGGGESDAAWTDELEDEVNAAVTRGRCTELPGDTLYY